MSDWCGREASEEPRGLRPLNSFWNAGFRRSGAFKAAAIVAVVAATHEDPADATQRGAESLRASRDAYNAELSFSVVYEDEAGGGATAALDVECDSYDAFFVLVTGFDLLRREAEAQRRSGEHAHDPDAPPETCWSCLQRTWARANEQLRAPPAPPQAADPVSHLFAPPPVADPLKTLQNHRRALSPFLQRPRAPSSSSKLDGGATGAADERRPRRLPVAQFLGWTSPGTQIWARLKMAGLEVKVSFGWDLRSVLLKVRCPRWRLEQMAQQMHLKLRTRDGRLRPFRVSRRDSFQAHGVGGNIFRSSERQQIIDYILRSKLPDGGADLDEHTELGRFIVQRFPLHMYSRLVEIRRTWVTFWKQERPGQLAEAWSPFSSSYGVTWTKLSTAVGVFCDRLLTQPIDGVAEYFGENIAFYFAFLAFYTRWLVIPAALGVVVFAVQLATQRFDHWLCAPYALVLMLWICLLLAYWRQKESALAYRWGVLDFEVDEAERPQFRGTAYLDEATNEWRKTYPAWRRLLRYAVSLPTVLAAIAASLALMTCVFYTQHLVYAQYQRGEALDFAPRFPSLHELAHGNWTADASAGGLGSGHGGVSLRALGDADFWAATFLYPCLYGMLTSLMALAFDRVALALNEFENHQTQTAFMNRLIVKVFSFQFVAIFTSLYAYAFFLPAQEASFARIAVTIFSFMTVGQWWAVFLDVCLPSLVHRALVYEMKARVAVVNRRIFAVRELSERPPGAEDAAAAEAAALQAKLAKRVRLLEQARGQCWEEALQARYNTFNDYAALVVQLSFLLTFGAVFPLAPLLALLNNVALLRCHAFKLCHTRQRPIAQKAGGIGVWSDVLQILSVGGALTNCALFGFVATPVRAWLLPRAGEAGIALLLFGFEQALLLFKYWLHTSVPAVPPSVQRAQLRERKSLSRKSFERARRRGALTAAGGGGGGTRGAGAGGAVGAASKAAAGAGAAVADDEVASARRRRKKSSLFQWLTGVADWADELALPPAAAPDASAAVAALRRWSPLSQRSSLSPYSPLAADDDDGAEAARDFADAGLVSRQPFAPLREPPTATAAAATARRSLAARPAAHDDGADDENRRPRNGAAADGARSGGDCDAAAYFAFDDDDDDAALGPPSDDDDGDELRPGDYGAFEIDGAVMDAAYDDDYDGCDDGDGDEEAPPPPPDDDDDDDADWFRHDDDGDSEGDGCSELTYSDGDFDGDGFAAGDGCDAEEAVPFSAQGLYSAGLLDDPQQLRLRQRIAEQHAQLRQLQQNLQQRRAMRQQQPRPTQPKRASQQSRAAAAATRRGSQTQRRGSQQSEAPRDWMMSLTAAALPQLTHAARPGARRESRLSADRRDAHALLQQLQPLRAPPRPPAQTRRASVSPPRAAAPPKTPGSAAKTQSPGPALAKSKPLVLLAAFDPLRDSPFGYTQQTLAPSSPPRSPPPAAAAGPQSPTRQLPSAAKPAAAAATPTRRPPVVETPTRSARASAAQATPQAAQGLNPFAFASPASASRPKRINFD